MTLADVARLAGVGLGTASRALNDAPGVSDATRRRVLEVAAHHSYVVSPDASRLAGGATRRVAVVVPHLSRWFFGAMVESMQGVFFEAGLDVLLYQVKDGEARHTFFAELPALRKVDALVAVGLDIDDLERKRLEIMGVHVVSAGGQHAVYPHVCIDDLEAGRLAVDHLLALGHRAIAMIETDDPDQAVHPHGRSKAFYAAMTRHRVEVDPRFVIKTSWGAEQGADASGTLLGYTDPPTAIYAHSDEVAFGAIRTIRRAGLRVPEDISVVGIDDHPVASLVDLTTVRQPVAGQGEAAARMVVDLLRGEDPPRAVTMPTTLIVRRSTARPRRRRDLSR
jgi:DNA-binding LacI/PurR family transcriptional regulator